VNPATGQFALSDHEWGVGERLIVPWTDSSAIGIGSEVNALGLVREGAQVGIWINGVAVVSLPLETSLGGVGLYAAGLCPTPCQMYFDDFTIRRRKTTLPTAAPSPTPLHAATPAPRPPARRIHKVYLPLAGRDLIAALLPPPEGSPLTVEIAFGTKVDADGHLIDPASSFAFGTEVLIARAAYRYAIPGTRLRWEWLVDGTVIDVPGLSDERSIDKPEGAVLSAIGAGDGGPLPPAVYALRVYASDRIGVVAQSSATVRSSALQEPSGRPPFASRRVIVPSRVPIFAREGP